MNVIEINQNHNTYPQKKRIKFCFNDKSSIEYDYNLIYSINPKIIITKSIIDEEGKYTINLPQKIRKEDLVEFLFLYIGSTKHDNNNNHNYFTNSRNKFITIINNEKRKFESFLEILLFFNNESFNNFLINNIFIPEMRKEKTIDFLLFSYKLLEMNKNSESQNSSYLNLFNLCFEKAGNNEKYLIKYYNKLKILDKDILRKIIEKIFFNLLNINCLLNTDEDSDYSINLDGCDNSNESSNSNNNSILNNNDIPNKIDDVGEEYVSIDYNKINESTSTMKKDNNYIIKFEDFRKLINILMDISNIYNIYDLLSIEYINILSNESINEFNANRKKCIFHKKIFFNSIKNNNLIYEECPLDIVINNKTIYLIVFYQPFERSINVCIKLKDNKVNNDKLFEHLNDSDYCFKLFTFYTSVQLCRGHNVFDTKKHNCIISLTNNKSMYNIFKSSISSTESINKSFMSNTINEDFFSIKAEIKLCHIYTGIISYLLQDFSTFSNDSHISKLSKQLFILLISNKYLDKKNENDIVSSLLLWLNDEINLKEDISELFYNINWENVDDALIFELIVKYSHYIANNESTQLIFYKIFEEKYGESPLVKKLINNIFSASKKINYEKIFSQMKNNDKFNNAYISYNSYLTFSNNKFKHIKTVQNNQIPSFDNIINKSDNTKIINKQKTDINSISNLNLSNNMKNNKNNTTYTKIKKKNISTKLSSSSFFKNDKKDNNIINYSKNSTQIREDSTLEKMKKIQKKINIKKINDTLTKKNIRNNNNNDNKKLKHVYTKNSTNDFMKLTLNNSNSNSTLYNFQNLFNKTFNNTIANIGKKEKKDNKNHKKNNSISLIKKNYYNIKIGNN